ncbi:MAG: aminotransferase class I/II-fold pyridoxal phosphate-dependent enzyme, partial [Chloroflexi bacterium]|nr:aminotransferase class I/II-fold pyridoxal phosphate-dependent enzyme [Chloroflexota bacterium]
AIAVSSGTSALIVALTAHSIGEGDEVLVPTFTYAATANAVLLVGARPVLVDIGADTFAIDVELAEAAVTPQTRAIVCVAPRYVANASSNSSTRGPCASRPERRTSRTACSSSGPISGSAIRIIRRVPRLIQT